MDIRDTREVLFPPYKPNMGLSQIMDLQKELLNHYIGIESLPKYPINPNIKSSQILLKDFIARIIEELGEGYESLVKGYRAFNESRAGGEMPNSLSYNYYNLYEEIADAMHFFMEVLIYLDINETNILNYSGIPITPTEGLGPLENLYIEGEKRLWVIIKKFEDLPDFSYSYPHYLQVEFETLAIDLNNLPIIFSKTVTTIVFPQLAWLCTYHLQLARNSLKNKPWKQTEMVTDQDNLRSEIVASFIYFLGVCKSLGLDLPSLYHLYYRKNQINHFRIKSNY